MLGNRVGHLPMPITLNRPQTGAFTLSKSQFIAYQQCPKRLWLKREGRKHGVFEIIDSNSRMRMEQGIYIHSLLQKAKPQNDLMITADYKNLEQAISQTEAALADSNVERIFEGAFYCAVDDQQDDMGIHVRVDMIEKVVGNDGKLTLSIAATEAKSIVDMYTHAQRINKDGNVTTSSKLKEHYLWDLAVQYFVLNANGIAIERAELMHLSRDYVHGGGANESDYDLQTLFTKIDLTEEVLKLQDSVKEILLKAKVTALQGSEPGDTVGSHCNSPVECGYKSSHCMPQELSYPPWHPERLYKITPELRKRMAAEGIKDLRLVPDEWFNPNITDDRMRLKQIIDLRSADVSRLQVFHGWKIDGLYKISVSLRAKFAIDGIQDLRDIKDFSKYFDEKDPDDAIRIQQIKNLQAGHFPPWHPRSLYGNNSRIAAKLINDGITDIRTIEEPEEYFDITTSNGALWMAQHLSLKNDQVVMRVEGLRAALGDLWDKVEAAGGILHSFDYEAMNQPLPILKGSHPYRHDPVQFSNHRLNTETGKLDHFEFLYDGALDGDYTLTMVRAMREALGDAGPIVVWYEDYEQGRIREAAEVLRARSDSESQELAMWLDTLTSDAGILAYINKLRKEQPWPDSNKIAEKIEAAMGRDGLLRDLAETYFRNEKKSGNNPDVGAEILRIINDKRIVDGYKIVKEFVYHPESTKAGKGSHSLKPISNNLSPEFTYKELPVNDGMQAGRVLAEILDPKTDPARRAQLTEDTLRYCRHDTENPLLIIALLTNLLNSRFEEQGNPELKFPYEDFQFGPRDPATGFLQVDSSTRLQLSNRG